MAFGKQGPAIYRFLATAAAVLLLAGVASVRGATTDTLADLVTNNGTLSLGDKVFSNFTFQESGLTTWDPSNIQVTLTSIGNVYFLTFTGNMSLVSISGPITSDLLLRYNVTASAGLIDSIDDSFTGSSQPSSTAFLAIDETARDSQGNVVGLTHLENSQHTNTSALSSPQATLAITTGVGFGISNSGLVTVSEISESFHQVAVPEPATTMLFGSGLLSGVLYLRRRRR
jgi:hypothetical protein